jgi:excisionase family DNA binding protein
MAKDIILLDDQDIPRGKHFKFLLEMLYELKKENEALRHEVINIRHPHPIMTISQLADLFDVTTRTIRNWMDSGLMPYYELGDRGVRFMREEVLGVLKKPSIQLFDPQKKIF